LIKKYHSMKILNSKQPSMDNKLKFSDRFKVSLNSDTRKGIDPYVFNDTEQPFVVSTGGKNIKLIAPKNSKIPNNSRNKSKGKCLKGKFKAEPPSNPVPKSDTGAELEATKTTRYPGQSDSYSLLEKHKYLRNLQRLKAKRRNRDHTLQYYPRAGEEISDSAGSEDELQTYQRHWYTGEADTSLARSSRLAQLHSQLQRQLQQLQCEDAELKSALKSKTRCLLEAAVRDPTATARILADSATSSKITEGPLIVGGLCATDGCHQTSLPCTRHCARHIMMNGDQLLFEHCTAKFSDNTQCCIPVFDVAHELPLCPEHARKRDNYHRRAQESKPKKARSKKPASPGDAVPTPATTTTTGTTTAPTSAAAAATAAAVAAAAAAAAAATAAAAAAATTAAAATGATTGAGAAASAAATSSSSHETCASGVLTIQRPSKSKSRPKKRKRPPLTSKPEVKAPGPPLSVAIAPLAIPPASVTASLVPEENHFASPIISCNEINTKTLNNLNVPPQISSNAVASLNNLALDIGSLGLGAGLKVELDDHEVFASLDHTTEHDFENVLNNLPADAFNDLFIGNS
jgi:hypothetical protein